MEKKLFDLEYEKWRDNQESEFLQSLVDPQNKLKGVKLLQGGFILETTFFETDLIDKFGL